MSISANSPSTTAIDALQSVRAKWGWFVVLGLVFIVLGFIVLGNLFTASVITALYAGVVIFIAGIAQIIHAFGVKGWGSFFFWLIAGVFYAIAGALMVYQPILAATWLTLAIGVMLAIEGIFRIVAAFRTQSASGWGWILVSGLVTLLLGLLIMARWPINSLYMLGLFLGIDLIFNGVGTVMFGFTLRRTAH